MTLYIHEAAKVIGVSTATLKRWFRSARVRDVARDRNGYRVFEPEDIERLRAFVNQRIEPPSYHLVADERPGTTAALGRPTRAARA
jgi:hypothetical protein